VWLRVGEWKRTHGEQSNTLRDQVFAWQRETSRSEALRKD
jgi:hypothetical protein